MARGDLIDVGYGTMSSPRTMCCSGFQWRYANTSAEAINTNSDIIEIFPYILRTATNYTPYSNDLRNSYVQITIGSSTTTQYLKTKYNFGNVSPINTKFHLTSEYNSSNPFGYGTPDSQTYLTSRTIDGKTAYGARFTVPHNTDGSAPTVSVKWVMVNSSSHSNIEKTQSLALDSIPRASVPTCANVTLGNAVTIYTHRVSTNFSHKLKIKIGSTQIGSDIVVSNTDENYSWTPAVSTYAPYITVGTQGTATIECTTYNGNTQTDANKVGTMQSTTCTLTVPNSNDTKPTVSISVTKGDSVVPSSWGSNFWVKGKSKLTITLTASPKYSTKIDLITSTANGGSFSWTNSNNDSGNITKSYTTSELTASGSVKATTSDKRGFTSAEATSSYAVVDYANPQILSDTTVARCKSDGTLDDSGTYVKYTFKATISGVSNKNASKYYVKYKQSGASSWTTMDSWETANNYSLTQTNIVRGGGNIDITKEYVFRFEAVDTFNDSNNPVYKEITVGTVSDLMNYNSSGKSMAIGGVSQRSSSEKYLDVYTDTEFHKPVIINEFEQGRVIYGGGGTSGYFYVCDITTSGQYSSQYMEFTFLQRSRYGKMILRLGGGSTTGAISGVEAYWILTIDNTIQGYYLLSNNKVQLYIQKSQGYDQMEVYVKKGFYETTGDGKVNISWVNTTVTSLPSGYTGIYGTTLRGSIGGNAATATSATSATKATQDENSENLVRTYAHSKQTGASSFDDVGGGGKLQRSGLYTESIGGTWYNLINVRHRNGEGDGTGYGLQIRNAMTTTTPSSMALQIRNQSNGTWGAWNTIQYTGVSLYDNSTGTSGTVTLSETSANFGYLDIYYKKVDSSNIASARIYAPNGKTVALSTIGRISNTSVQIERANVTISGTSITKADYNYANIPNGSSQTVSNGNELNIVKVVGYRN